MPTYEYQCSKCGAVFDVFQSITASPLRKALCEECGKKQTVKRLIGIGGAILFKGSGFYETDYRSEGYTKAAKVEKEKKSDSKSSKSTKEKSEKKAPSPEATSTSTNTSSPKGDHTNPSSAPKKE